MALSKTEIDAVVDEIAPQVTGGWIQKVFQPLPKGIVLEIRARGQTVVLFVSADTETARLHIAFQRLPNPPTPPPFCQYLRAHIQGSRIEQVASAGTDRIVRLSLTAKEGPCTLIAALTGRSADLLLVNAEDRILNSLKHGAEKAGRFYTPPATPTAGASRSERVRQVELDEDSLFPISHAIERRYKQREEELARQRLRQARLSHVRKAIKKVERRAKALADDLVKAERYRDYARYGELLKANLGLISKGQETVTVVDYFDPALPELVIPLDPARSPQSNMDDYFKKHRKHLLAEREIRPRLRQAEQDLEALRDDLKAIQQFTWQPHAPSAPSSTAGATPPPSQRERRATKRQARSGPFRKFLSSDGLPIYVGRNARENEELTHKFAHSDDLWLHARGAPGSHVVVRLEKGSDPPPETLRDAETLALLYSDLKKSGRGEIIYTRKKWVRKAKGHPRGAVIVTREKSIFANVDKVRLEAIRARSR